MEAQSWRLCSAVRERQAAGGQPAQGTRSAGQDRFQKRRTALRLGGTGQLGAGSRWRSRGFITYYPDLAVPGATEAIQAFCAQAMKTGVRRLVLLSGRGEEEAQRAEQALIAGGARWTIVRASWFAQNFSESFFLEPLLAGELALPAGAIGEPFIDAEDIADVATAALMDDRHIGQLYEVTGPRLLTFAEAVAEIAKASGRTDSLSGTTTRGLRRNDGGKELLGADVAPFLLYLFTTVLDGRNAYVIDGVEQAVGRKPRDFEIYAQETAATGIWRA